MSETEKRKIKVFIASPNDLAEERRKFRSAIDVLNIGFGDGANVEFIPLGWEDTLASTGRRSQGVINQDIDSCDVFILTMHRRWGQDAPDAAPYSSYTEEEFHRALERWKKSSVPEIFVFFKRVDAASEADAGPQLSKVIKFRQHLEETRQILYRYFDSPESFLDEVDTHLRAYAKGDLPKAEDRDDTVVLPVAALEEVEKAKQLALQKTEEARLANDAAEEARLKIEEAQLEMAEVAAQLAMEGKVEFAREKFTKLVADTMNLRILYLGYEFFKRTGDLNSALNILEKWLDLADIENEGAGNAAVIGNLGNLCRILGDFERAEEMYQTSLHLNECAGDKKGIVNCYCNLAILSDIRGDFERAENMFLKAQTIAEALNHTVGISTIYGNLGSLYEARGKLRRAGDMYQKALAIDEAQDHKEGMVSQYGNLGNLYLSRGEFNDAEQMFQKSLDIAELLCYKEGVASQYCNLGNLYIKQEQYEKTEEMYQKALAISEALGHKEGMARDYGNLGSLYHTCGDLEWAEKMYLKSLTIDKALGRKEGMAIIYCNLGILSEDRDEFERAEEMYKKSIVIFRALQSPKENLVINLLNKLKSELPSEDGVEA